MKLLLIMLAFFLPATPNAPRAQPETCVCMKPVVDVPLVRNDDDRPERGRKGIR